MMIMKLMRLKLDTLSYIIINIIISIMEGHWKEGLKCA